MTIPWHFKKDVNLGEFMQGGCGDVGQYQESATLAKTSYK